MAKVISASQAAELIKDNDTILSAVSGLAGWPEETALAVRDRFLSEGHPKNITHVHAAGAGDWISRGECAWAEDGLMTTHIASHVGSSPKAAKAVSDNKIKSWCFPLGTMIQLFREIGRRGPGLYSKTGLGTFIDPRQTGGKVNKSAQDDPRQLVEVHTIDGEEWMFYKKIHFNVGLMRGTTADTNGNITIEKEMLSLEMLVAAQAVKACGGIVIVEVESLSNSGTMNPKLVKVPGIYVDYIVVAQNPENIMQTQGTKYNRVYSGEIKVPLGNIPPIPLDISKVICRRAAIELKPGNKVNFGIGTPLKIANVLNEEGCFDFVKMLSENGSIGGVPAIGKDFGAHWNIEASCDQGDHFSLFDGGGLDVGVFGLSEVDKSGNVNTSFLNGKAMGVGGFINVSSNANLALFVGTLTAGGNEAIIEDGKVVITKEGRFKKFVDSVAQLTFNGDFALNKGNRIVFITERCVIERKPEGMVLTEIAPGIDLQRDILDQMGFMPIIPQGGPKLMDEKLFKENWGGLKSIMESY